MSEGKERCAKRAKLDPPFENPSDDGMHYRCTQKYNKTLQKNTKNTKIILQVNLLLTKVMWITYSVWKSGYIYLWVTFYSDTCRLGNNSGRSKGRGRWNKSRVFDPWQKGRSSPSYQQRGVLDEQRPKSER
jgi:hypothetical protein